MDALQKLPGFQRTPYGLECRILRRLPLALLLSLLVPALVSLLARALLPNVEPGALGAREAERLLPLIDYLMIGAGSLLWFLGATLGMGCIIVWLMKGPAYVADAYDFNGPVMDPGSSPG
jgi:hypothetical protein